MKTFPLVYGSYAHGYPKHHLYPAQPIRVEEHNFPYLITEMQASQWANFALKTKVLTGIYAKEFEYLFVPWVEPKDLIAVQNQAIYYTGDTDMHNGVWVLMDIGVHFLPSAIKGDYKTIKYPNIFYSSK